MQYQVINALLNIYWKIQVIKEMETQLIKLDSNNIDEELITKAGQIIMDGGLVAFPTETVYGLGGDALNSSSSEKIYKAKGRPSDNPLIVHIADIDDIYKIASEVPENTLKLAKSFWPGPLTMVLKKSDLVPSETTGGLNTVAVRMPDNKIALEFIRKAGGFVAAPSANKSGRPSTTSAQHVMEDMKDRIDMIIDGGSSTIGLESTIIDLTEEIPVILRPGYITINRLSRVVGDVIFDPAIIEADSDQAPRAPGMKYKHYAPKGDLVIIKGDEEKVVSYISAQTKKALQDGERVGIIASNETYMKYQATVVQNMGSRDDEVMIAKRLYAVLRDFDAEEITRIYSEDFNTPNMGQAIMNRLIKAAGHSIINL